MTHTKTYKVGGLFYFEGGRVSFGERENRRWLLDKKVNLLLSIHRVIIRKSREEEEDEIQHTTQNDTIQL